MEESEVIRDVKQSTDLAAGYSNPTLLYSGAFSQIYRISKAGKHFLLKTAKDSTSLSLIQREYEIALPLDHPGIAKVFTYEKDTPAGEGIVMEYVDGRDLDAYLKENPNPNERRRVFSQLLDAVAYLHRCGIVHNDLKPSNVLISKKDNSVKLIDFGLADNDAHFVLASLGGTRAYSSPELLAGESVDSRSDIYSLGYIMRDIFGKKYGRINKKCLNGRKEDRYSNVDSLQRAFRNHSRPIYFALALALICALGFLIYSTSNKGHEALKQIEKVAPVIDSVAVRSDSLSARVDLQDSLCREAKRIIDGIYSNTTGSTTQEKLDNFTNRLNTDAYPILESWRNKYSASIMESVEYTWSKASLDYTESLTKQWLAEMEAEK